MRHSSATILAIATLSGCVPAKDYTPKERYLNRVAGAEIAARDCPAFGGYGSVAQMRQDAASNKAMAMQLGATEADLDAARKDVQSQYATAWFAVGQAEACRMLINRLAWAGTDSPT